MDLRRVQTLRSGRSGAGPVVYWMSRDQRIHDNWALVYAQKRAQEQQRAVVILFCLLPSFWGATWRAYDFMLGGLKETCQTSLQLGIPFVVRCGQPNTVVPALVQSLDAESVVCDFDPLRQKRQWRQAVLEAVQVPVVMVDAHNIVPCWETSDKQEYAARTIRPKISKKLSDFLYPLPTVAPQSASVSGPELQEPDWEALEGSLSIDRSVPPVRWLRPGPAAAWETMDQFLEHGLEAYAQKRNDPNAKAQSNLSPYFHFGHLSPQRVAERIQTLDHNTSAQAKEAYLEEMVVRRELADNFCWYNEAYDSFLGLPRWAQETLNAHRLDPRPYLYTYDEFQAAATHDQLWNAAQREMVDTGKMHGYMRMYWAKKILEWTGAPEQAIEFAITLNDRYELDGRDPNGYVGVLWSIGGVHDRGFRQRPVSGTIRPMTYAGCTRKFDVAAYMQRFV